MEYYQIYVFSLHELAASMEAQHGYMYLFINSNYWANGTQLQRRFGSRVSIFQIGPTCITCTLKSCRTSTEMKAVK